MQKSPYKEDAIKLRKKGLSFSEIQKKLPVSHSSLSI
jgi:orotate phosphoribosyltransferase-like protein